MNAKLASHALWFAGYLAVMGLITLGMFGVRHWALSTFDTEESRADWDAWREQSQQLAAQPGPVARRAAASPEPPTIVLMRDYFTTCLVALLVLSSVLLATFAFMIRGVAAGPALVVELEDEQQPQSTLSPEGRLL